MSKLCEESIMRGYHSHRCGKPAKFEVDGHHYCGIHNPNKAPTKAQIEASENHKRQKEKRRLEYAAPELLDALETLCNGLEWNIENHPTIMNESDSKALADARAVIAKATNAS